MYLTHPTSSVADAQPAEDKQAQENAELRAQIKLQQELIGQQQLQLNLVSEDKRKVSHAMIELLRDNARKRDEASAAFEQKAAAKQRMKVSPAILLTSEQGKAYLEEKEAARQAKAEKKKRKVEGDAGTGKGSAKKRKSAAAASSGAASSGAQSSAGSSNGKNEVAMDVDVPNNASASSASGQANAGAGKKRTAARPASKQPAKRQRPIRDAALERRKADQNLYCICQKRDDLGNYIQCCNPHCKYGTWFHYACLKIDEPDEDDDEEAWYCPNCTEMLKNHQKSN